MAFELKNVVPWGRNLEEYTKMFALSEMDLQQKVISFGDGPASFNAEMTAQQHSVISLDPVYQFSREEIQRRIAETKEVVITQTRKNKANFVWKHIKDVDELARIRMEAMQSFLSDFEAGKQEGRYITHTLPERTHFADLSFDIGLSSHFLILYDQLGLDFHLQSITEMLRLCRELRIFPLLNLNAEKSDVLDGIINHFAPEYTLDIVQVDYEFQKNGNEMLRIKRK
ncbi:SAM-dependent methyltransferase [Catalinimonas niigatensis]|uniref:SAM-dependent methyltransferase n=1 Tax=Catalinimonas niigatensis TaxID=1397264 RepID=UPI002665EA53|nr:SAM-dependent methyltransferase [Catalinimonas niigatensis]WPP49283.1 SAM-dependent methyltransferase [Catalinimonas niigatensis]